MDDEDAFPNFNSAFPTPSPAPVKPTESASWHPALRSSNNDHNEIERSATHDLAASEGDDDFYSRYPGATPKKKLPALSVPGIEDGAEDVEDEVSSPTAAPSEDARDFGTSSNQRTLPQEAQDIQGLHAKDEASIHRHVLGGNEVKDEEDPIPVPYQETKLDDTSSEHRERGDELPSYDERTHVSRDAEQLAESHSSAEQPADHYEHQGEVLEMDEAQDESESAPLMEDEEAPPTPGLVNEPMLDLEADDEEPLEDSARLPDDEHSVEATDHLDGEASPRQPQSKAFAAPPHIDRSFTTNFTTAPSASAMKPKQSASNPVDDWDASGDDDETFGALLDSHGDAHAPQLQTLAEEDASERIHPKPTSPPATEPTEEDLAAAWQAALMDEDPLVDDEDELLLDSPTSPDESRDLDPSTLFDSDGDDFLDDNEEDARPDLSHLQPQQRSTYTRIQQQQQQSTRPNPYSAASNSFVNQAHGRSGGTPDTGLFDLYGQPSPPLQAQSQQQQRPSAQTAQSFADKSKGGYQSPYDLPMDIVKPRRRAAPPTSTTAAAAPMPPPRSSSYSISSGSQPVNTPPQAVSQPSRAPDSTASTMRPQSSQSGGSAPVNGVSGSAKSTPKAESSFFEDLPMKPKARGRPSGGYTPQQSTAPSMSTTPLGPPQHARPTPPSALRTGPAQQQQSRTQPPIAQPSQRPAIVHAATEQPGMHSLGLRQPERLPLLPEQQQIATNLANTTTQTLPSRFSPAPPSQPSAPSRYSPGPAAAPSQSRTRFAPGQASAPSHIAFVPRTSSPLAQPQMEKPHPSLPRDASRGSISMSPPRINSYAPEEQAAQYGGQGLSRSSYQAEASVPTPSQPSYQTQAPPQSHAPPPRSQTQSPGAMMKQPRLAMTKIERPTSAIGMSSSRGAVQRPVQSVQQPTQPSRGPALPHRRTFSRELTFTAPQDESSQDPLERWKGRPIFTWTSSGSVLHSFPKRTPFYSSGNSAPSVKCTPGPIIVEDASAFLPMDELNAKFPGPLAARSKGRKKEVLTWLTSKVEDLERQTERAMLDFDTSTETKMRKDEKLVLWRIVRMFVENDSALEGNPKLEEEVRKVLLPNLAQMGQVMELQSPSSAATQVEAVDGAVLLQLRQALFEGQRERAVWLAEEKKLWGHALLLASTMGPEVWKQIVQSFVRSQVKSVGSDARSLAALYQIFAGNSEECVDELVPPSARAGFKMINRVDGAVTGNPLDGLDQWRETLALVTSNRTPSDGPSLIALGKLLTSYGRVEAAHTCLLFARPFLKHSGADDIESHFVLLGANHESKIEVIGSDLDAILLTEIYEWATSLSAPSTTVPYIPHLQSYKLLHAQQLAAYGLKSKAQSYCEHITAAYTSTTRPSQYYHPTFTQAVTDLGAFLSQSPQDGKGGFFSKPAMNKVSSGAASWFTRFVSGDEDQSAGSTTGQVAGIESGPFGRVSGELSRSESGAELYNPMVTQATPALTLPYTPLAASSVATSKAFPDQPPLNRYAPGASFSPPGGAAASLQPLGIPVVDQRPASAGRAGPSRYAPMHPSQRALSIPRPDVSRAASDYSVPYNASSRRGSAQDPGSQGSYEPTPSLAQEPNPYGYAPSPMPQMPVMPDEDSEDAFARPNGGEPQLGYQPSGLDSEAEDGGYQPFTTSGYEPPSYQPHEPEPEVEEESAPRKRGIMDDDDDDGMAKRAAALKKSQADREADDAFRKAAEADAARDGGQSLDGKKKASGWLGGWFKGGKEQPGDLAGKPIRAKLGEESSFVYDETLKKWVNKKGGPEVATATASTAPPPRGPPSRASSAAIGPPSGPPSRVASAVGTPSFGSRPPTSGSCQGPQGSGPPSRVATPASEGSAPLALGAMLNGGAGSGPSSRPATSMSTSNDLDSLLGGPPGAGARKGGTVKGKKKGGRYVDVMAK